MACHWVYTKEVPEGRFWLPECWGGLYGPDGCYCHSGEKAKNDREALEERIDQLEARIAKLEKRNAP